MKKKWSNKKKAVMQLINYYEFKGDSENAKRLRLKHAEELNK